MKKLKYIAIALLVLCLMPVGAKAKTICEYEYTAYSSKASWSGAINGTTTETPAHRVFKIQLNIGNNSNKYFASVSWEKQESGSYGTLGDAAKIPESGKISAQNFEYLRGTGKVKFSEGADGIMMGGFCPSFAMITKDGKVCFGAKAVECYVSGLSLNDASSKLINQKENYDENYTLKGQLDKDVFDNLTGTAKKYHDDPQLYADIDFDLEGRDGCAVFGRLTSKLASIYSTIRLLIIGALIVFTIVDFTKAMTSDKDDALTKAFKHLVIRFVIIIVMFILPLLIQFFLGIFFGGNWQACLTDF